jgi:hypothetical protein
LQVKINWLALELAYLEIHTFSLKQEPSQGNTRPDSRFGYAARAAGGQTPGKCTAEARQAAVDFAWIAILTSTGCLNY